MKTLLFLHGWGGNEYTFAPIRQFFEDRFRCIFINFNCNPDTVMTLDDYCGQVIDFLEENGVEKCHIIAHSFGARVAVLLANRRPELIDKLVLTGAAGLPARFNLRVWLKIRLYKLRRRIFGHAKGGSSDYRKLSDTGKATFQNVIGRDLSAEISKVDKPTLLVWGRHDKSTPPYMLKRWTKLQKRAKIKLFARSGHFCFIDEPARFIKEVWEFLV